MTDVPEIEIRSTGEGRFFVICDDMNCPVNLDTFNEDEAREEQACHLYWHENGMPQ